MNLADKSYLAGIIDGEGTVTLVRRHINENYSPEISVANTNMLLIKWLRKTANGGTITKKKKALAHHSDAWTWRLRGNKALEVLKNVRKYLIIKRTHADLLLRDYKQYTPRNGKYTTNQLQKKMELVRKIKKLNLK